MHPVFTAHPEATNGSLVPTTPICYHSYLIVTRHRGLGSGAQCAFDDHAAGPLRDSPRLGLPHRLEDKLFERHSAFDLSLDRDQPGFSYPIARERPRSVIPAAVASLCRRPSRTHARRLERHSR
jgi:hypothetical protein